MALWTPREFAGELRRESSEGSWKLPAGRTMCGKVYTEQEVSTSLQMVSQALQLKNKTIAELQAQLQAVSLQPAAVVHLTLNVVDAAAAPAPDGACSPSPLAAINSQLLLRGGEDSLSDGAVSCAARESARAARPASSSSSSNSNSSSQSKAGSCGSIEHGAAALQLQRDQAELRASEAAAELQEAEAALAETRAALEGATAERDQLQQASEQAEQRASEAAAHLQAAEAALAGSRAALEGVTAERDQLQQARAEAEQRANKSEERLQAAEAALAGSRAALESTAAERDQLREAKAEAERAAADLAAVSAQLQAASDKISKQDVLLTDLQRDKAEAEQRASEAQVELQVMYSQLQQARGALEQSQVQAAGLREGAAKQEATIAQLQRGKAEAEERAERATAQLRSMAEDLGSTRAALKQSQAEAAALREDVAAREEVILQLQQAKLEIEAEQMQLCTTLQQYLGMCDMTGSFSPVHPSMKSPLASSSVLLGTPGRDGSASAAGASALWDSLGLNANSTDRMKRLEERLEFWHHRLESAAKLRTGRRPTSAAASPSYGRSPRIVGGGGSLCGSLGGSPRVFGGGGGGGGSGVAGDEAEGCVRLEGAFAAAAAAVAGTASPGGSRLAPRGPVSRQLGQLGQLGPEIAHPAMMVSPFMVRAGSEAESDLGPASLLLDDEHDSGSAGEDAAAALQAAGSGACELEEGEGEGGGPTSPHVLSPPRDIPEQQQQQQARHELASHPIQVTPTSSYASTWKGTPTPTPTPPAVAASGGNLLLQAGSTAAARQRGLAELASSSDGSDVGLAMVGSTTPKFVPRLSLMATAAASASAPAPAQQPSPLPLPPASVTRLASAEAALSASGAASPKGGVPPTTLLYRPASRIQPPSPPVSTRSVSSGSLDSPKCQQAAGLPASRIPTPGRHAAASEQQQQQQGAAQLPRPQPSALRRSSQAGGSATARSSQSPRLRVDMRSVAKGVRVSPASSPAARFSPAGKLSPGKARRALSDPPSARASPSQGASGAASPAGRAAAPRTRSSKGRQEQGSSGDGRDIQGEFATELLERLNIGSPRKAGGSSQ